MGLFGRSPPGPPPAPPLPSEGPRLKAKKGRRLRRFHWEPIPAERVLGRRNLWTAASGSRPGGGRLGLDLALLEALFGQPAAEGPAALGGARAPGGQVSLLEAKKVLNLGIFLKQFKRPAGEIVADLQAGEGASYGAEKLLELKKMLPDAEEKGPKVAHGGTTGDGCSGVGLFLVLLTISSVSTLAGRSSVPMAGRSKGWRPSKVTRAASRSRRSLPSSSSRCPATPVAWSC